MISNKKIMAANILHYMDVNNVNATEICRALHIKQNTFSDWVNAKTYPRIDKIEMLANYFNISKADLVEEQPPEAQEVIDRIKTKLSAMGPAAGSMWDDMQKDPVFKDHVELLWSLPPEQRSEIYNYIKYHYYKTEEKKDEPLHA